MTEKSLADYSPSEEAQWRAYEDDPIKFLQSLSWSPQDKEFFHLSFQRAFKQRGVRFKDYLISTALTEVRYVKDLIEEPEREQVVRWSSLPLSRKVQMTDTSCDDLICCWLEIKEINYEILSDHEEKYIKLLRRLLPIKPTPDMVVSAFHRDEKQTPEGRLPSLELYRKLLEYYKAYGIGTKYMAPYMSVIDPSGVGKSFSIAQIAYQHGVYVIYSSLPREGSLPYPARSVIANRLPRSEPRANQVTFWESYLTTALYDVELCRRIGICPGGFYYLQTIAMYRDYQHDFSRRVSALYYHRYRDTQRFANLRQEDDFKLLEEYTNQAQKELESWLPVLNRNGHNSSVKAASPEKNTPNAIVCIDEARTLFDGTESLLFRSLLEALRKQFAKIQGGEYRNLSRPHGDFFAVLLDTTPKMAGFSPPTRHDRIQTRLWEKGKLFPPLYATDTFDIFVKDDKKRLVFPDGSPDSALELFGYGRPLWGARIDADESLQDLTRLAAQKLEGHGPSYLLALLSHRLNFYIVNNALAEDLVSGWLHYIVYINEARDMLRTTQPSEPILAHTSAQLMLSSKTRLGVVEQYIHVAFEGSIHVGDMGEMTSALILLFTFDEVWKNEIGGFPGAIPLSIFLETLLGKNVASDIVDCASTDKDMRGLCKNGKIFFNHFTKLEEEPDKTTLQKGFYRGIAFFLPDNHPGADILIPLRISNRKMSFLAIQVKNRKEDSYSAELRDETRTSFQVASETLGFNVPFIGLTMALRDSENSQATNNFGIVYPEAMSGYGSTGFKWPTENKSILLLAVGLNENVYPKITSCNGEKSPESERILPLLRRLLDCKTLRSLPDDANKVYVNRLTHFH